MKLSIRNSLAASLLGLVFLGAANGFAAETNRTLAVYARTAKPVVAPPQSATEAPVMPLSTFIIPRKAVDGRDPFFPNSTRIYGMDASVTTNRAPAVVADLTLKGISGTPEQPLAIINTTTFTTGEANEVLIKNGRLRVVCVEINMAAGTVLVQIGAERRELRLAPDKLPADK
jgi:hypothetical protein